jgi:LPS-assembly protein
MWFSLLLSIFILLSSGAKAGKEIKPDSQIPTLLKADEIENYRELGLVIAKGSVEAIHQDKILRADSLTYNQKKDIIYAEGNITLLQPNGEVLFSDSLEIKGDFREGIAQNIRILLADNSRAVAASGRISGEKVLDMKKASYTPCKPCLDPSAAPFWQIRAYNFRQNRKSETIEYRDAFLDILGIPVVYTPYLSHPDPKVRRKTGLLSTSMGSTTELGTYLKQPFFYALAEDRDITFEFMPTSKGGQLIKNEYRQRLRDGYLELQFSLANTDLLSDNAKEPEKDNKFQGHIEGSGRYDISEYWNLSGAVRLTSDDTYLQRYRMSQDAILQNQISLQGFYGDSFLSAETYYWQDLRANKSQDTMPFVLPILKYHFISPSTSAGGHLDLNADAVFLGRENGIDSKRLSLKTAWNQETISQTGQVLSVYAEVQTDLYYASNVQTSDPTSGYSGRLHPKIGADWRLPLETNPGNASYVLEPIAGIMLSPGVKRKGLIPNEDSKAVEFDDTNLTSRNMFPGRDRIDGGQRIYYGVGFATNLQGGYSSGFLGQTYRLSKETDFPAGSGLEEEASDFVGRITVQPNAPFYIHYKFQLDKNAKKFKRNSFFLNSGTPLFNARVNYDFVDVGAGSGTLPNREEISFTATSRINSSWSADTSTTHDLVNGFTSRQTFGLTYQNDCFRLRTSYNREFFQDRDLKPNDTLWFQFHFKNLGDLATSTGIP